MDDKTKKISGTLMLQHIIFFGKRLYILKKKQSLNDDSVFPPYSTREKCNLQWWLRKLILLRKPVGHSESRPQLNDALVNNFAISKVHSEHKELRSSRLQIRLSQNSLYSFWPFVNIDTPSHLVVSSLPMFFWPKCIYCSRIT